MAEFRIKRKDPAPKEVQEEVSEEDLAIRFHNVHPSPDSVKAVSRYFKIKFINILSIVTSIILAIILALLTNSFYNISFGTVIAFICVIIGIPAIVIPTNIVIAHNSYGRIWYDYLEWFETVIIPLGNEPDFETIIADKYFVATEYSDKDLSSDTKKSYDAEIIKIVLGVVFLIAGLILYVYLMFKTELSFIVLTLVMMAFGGICIFIISDASFELRKIRILGNKINE